MGEIDERIKFLDDLISWFGQPPFRVKDRAKAMLTEIKGILEQQDNIHAIGFRDGVVAERKQYPRPSDDEELEHGGLIDAIKVLIEDDGHLRVSQIRNHLLLVVKALQQRQPEKPKITRGEIEEWLEENWNEDWCDPLHFVATLEWLIDLLKSKGFEITDK